MTRLQSNAWAMAIVLGVALSIVCPAAASAQGSIEGTVTDRSGARLAGVTVEASSPALIERVRIAVTDRTGQYAIVGLPPGTFSVTFRLAGFALLTRAAIHTTATFVTTVDATLEIGALGETVDVRSPLIDRQTTQQAVAISAALVAEIPTGRSLANLAGLIPGVTTLSARAQSDVGGVNNLQNQFVAIHGGRFSDQRTYVDGVTIRNLQSEGHATNFTPDMSSTQEVVVDTAGVTAEEGGAGVRANYIPRTGGNTFHSSFFATGASGAFQADNLPREVKAGNRLNPESLKLTYDVNPAIGGPIVRDRVWFFAAGRAQSNQAYIGGISENRNAGNPAAWTYDPDPSRPGRFAITQQGLNARVTWRPTPKQKVSGFVEKQWRSWDEGNVARAPEAFSRFRFSKNQIAILSWSATLSDRLLLDARGAYHAEEWLNVGGDELLPNNRALIPVLEQGGAFPGLMYRGKNGVYTGQSAPFIKIGEASATYVTGAHVVKAGVDLLGGKNTSVNTFTDSALQYRFNDGVPNQVTAFATPYTLAWRVTELGAFVQDRWTRNRSTLNAGIRLDLFSTSFPEHHLGPATLFPFRNVTLPAADWYGLKDLSPRVGGAFDLTGTGRTVLKATAGRYVVALSPAAGNPIASLPLSATRIWNDADRDYVPDCDLVNSAANGECGVMSDGNFGGVTPSLRYDPAILRGWNVRPYNWEFTTGLQHEIRPHVAAGVWYIRRIYGNFTVQDNRATSAGDYTGFAVPAPVDGRLPGGGGYPVGGLYDLNPDKLGLVDNYVTAADRYGRQVEHWNGIDAIMTVTRSRLMVQGGLSTGRTSTDVCALAWRLPEILGAPGSMTGVRPIPTSLDQCRLQSVFLTQTKWIGRYLIPRIDVQLAGTFQSTPGVEVQAVYVAPNAIVQPGLGRPLSSGVTASVPLIRPGSVYGDRVNQVDLRVGKVFRSARLRAGLNFDLYNAFNASPVTAANMNYAGNGAAWLQPQAILPARLFKVSAQIEF